MSVELRRIGLDDGSLAWDAVQPFFTKRHYHAPDPQEPGDMIKDLLALDKTV